MDVATRLAWVFLALIHLPPAAVSISPRLLVRLYGVEPGGDVGVLLAHRGALFLGIVAACGFAALRPEARRAVGIVVAVSVIGFLIVYARAGLPAGPLRMIAIGDLVALVPLALVLVEGWRVRAP